MTIMNLYSNDDINLVEEEFSYFATIPMIDGFIFIGWTKDDTTLEIGDRPKGLLSTDGNYYMPVFLNNFLDKPLSEEEYDREQKDIDNGKNACIFVHGYGEHSYIKRYTSKELKYIDFSFFDDKDEFESYIYRS